MTPIAKDHPLRRLFAGQVEQVFCAEVGMCDPRLTDYMVDPLVDFTRMDRLVVLRNAAEKTLEQVAVQLMLHETQRPLNEQERDCTVYRHIGDYSLFWAGMYPEHLRAASRKSTDLFLNYVAQGKKSYAIVSEMAGDSYVPPPVLFRNLSDEFETCLHGLGLVRKSWETAPPLGPDFAGEILY